jgi:hypothetical protein
MSNSDPYTALGVTERASFEEVRSARDRLLASAEGDQARQEEIEAAYDAVLMDRLRARKEGRIPVPDRIRYPEKTTTSSTLGFNGGSARPPSWLSKMLYSPTRREMLVSGLIFLGLWGAMVLIPKALTTWLAIALLLGIYFINRNGRKFGMAVLFALVGLGVGLGLAYAIYLIPPLQYAPFPNSLSLLIVAIVLWCAATFLG